MAFKTKKILSEKKRKKIEQAQMDFLDKQLKKIEKALIIRNNLNKTF